MGFTLNIKEKGGYRMKKLFCVILTVGMLFGGSLAVCATTVMDTAGTGNMTMTRPDPDEDFSVAAVLPGFEITGMTRPDPDEDF